MTDYNNLLEIAKIAALRAGVEILKIYNSTDFEVESKEDNSPLTRADKEANKVIFETLKETRINILSEEGLDIPFHVRKNWTKFWMIDPLDGTKEFLKKNDQFTVNIALIENNQPTLGVVFVPALNKLFFGGSAIGFSYLEQDGKVLELSKKTNASLNDLLTANPCRIVASLSHRNKETDDFILKFVKPEIVSMGSSLKFMLLAEKKADIYPRLAPTMEWDTAAADAILRPLNYSVKQFDKTDELLLYNKEKLLNPSFIVF